MLAAAVVVRVVLVLRSGGAPHVLESGSAARAHTLLQLPESALRSSLVLLLALVLRPAIVAVDLAGLVVLIARSVVQQVQTLVRDEERSLSQVLLVVRVVSGCSQNVSLGYAV